MDQTHPFIPYSPLPLAPEGLAERARAVHAFMNRRRSVRDFADTPVPFSVIADLVRAAGTAPSGAHKQPWTFCVVGDPELKRRIREAAEAEEHASYHGRMPAEWLADLAPLGTDWRKPFLETAPWLVVVFKQVHGLAPDGSKRKHYYVEESVGIACGFLLAAIHQAGLVALTHTPSPMGFLTTLLGRPANERPFLLIPVGFPAAQASVPDLERAPLERILVRY